MKQKLKEFALVTLGTFISAIAFNTMLVDNHIASGGVGGLAISMQALFGWNTANFILYTNIPLLLICFFFLGKEVFIKTIYGAWVYPIFIKLTAGLPTLTHNAFLAAIFGGAILGFGLGLVFIGNSSTGGTGIIIQLLEKYTPIPLGVCIVLVDGIVVGLGFIAFDPDTVMYSTIALLSITYVVNLMIAGADSSRNIMIISKEHAKIKEYITTIADRGVTELPIVGGFTGHENRMLMTTISRLEYQQLETAILSIDETAFIVVMPATQVKGRGFSLQKNHPSLEQDILIPM